MSSTDPSNWPTVLVADDDVETVRLVGLILGQAGYYVVAAHDGLETLEILDGIQADAVLLDLRMPYLDGWRTLERLQSRGRAPVIVMTELDNDHSRERCRALGAVDYMTKPVVAKDLIMRVQRACRRAPPA